MYLQTGAFRSNKFSHHCLPVRARHSFTSGTVLNVGDWSTYNHGGAGQGRYPVGKVRNSTRRHI